METLRIADKVLTVSQVAEKIHIAAADLSALVDAGVSHKKVMPQAIMVTHAAIKVAEKIDGITAEIEDAARDLQNTVDKKVQRGKRIEIRIVK